MKMTTAMRLWAVAILVPVVVAGCFSSTPQRRQTQGEGSGQPGSTSTSAPSSQSGNPSRGPQTSNPSAGQASTSQGRQPNQNQAGEQAGAEDAGANVRVASAQRPGTATASTDMPADQNSSASESQAQQPVGAAEALEAANAAVDAAATAVADAEQTIEQAREAVLAQESGARGGDSFDPWQEPGGASEASGDAGAARSAASDEAQDGNSGASQGAENFDPFAVFNEAGGGQAQPTQGQVNAGSLQIADDALATANAALNRARRALIAAAGAGEGDADAEAVQMAAASAALEAAAEAVVASAIAVMAAASGMDYEGEPITDPAEIQAAMEQFAEGVAMVVGVLHRQMRDASDTLNATADLLTAAGQLIAMVGNAGATDQQPDQPELSSGERVASLDRQLDRSLAVFDEKMSAESGAAGAGVASTEDQTGTLATGSVTDPGAVGGTMSSDGRTGSGDRPINRPDGTWADSDNNVPRKRTTAEGSKDEEFQLEERGPAQDDDIVARQLREAALAETDPELREKLWQEYYAYKESLEQGEAATNQ